MLSSNAALGYALAMGLGLHQYGELIINIIDGGLIGVIVASLLAA